MLVYKLEFFRIYLNYWRWWQIDMKMKYYFEWNKFCKHLNFRANVFCNFSHGVKEFQYTFEMYIDVIDFVLYFIQFVAK